MNRAPLACSRYTSTRRCGTSISTRSTDHGVVTPSSCRYNSMLSIASPPLGDCATAYQLPRRPTPNPDGPFFIAYSALAKLRWDTVVQGCSSMRSRMHVSCRVRRIDQRFPRHVVPGALAEFADE